MDLCLNGKENHLVVHCGKRGKKRDVYLDDEIVVHWKSYVEIKKQWGEPIRT